MGQKIDLTGQTFGRLTVLRESPKRTRNGCVHWVCQCSCPEKTIVTVSAGSLKRGTTVSCGCYHREQVRNLNFIDLTGQTFNYLLVLEEIPDKRLRGQVWWKCKCLNENCGNITEATTLDLKSGNKKSCGCLKSAGEQKIQHILQIHNIPFEKEYSFQDCFLPSGQKAKFDFYVNNSYIIEFDGEQHFFSRSGWNTDEHLKKTQERDKIKNEYCAENNIPIIRIPYTHIEDISLEDLMPESSVYLLQTEN